MKRLLITIDGPSGAGKTTVSRKLAERLGYTYVDTGALYRGLAVMAQEAGISDHDEAALAALCGSVVLRFVPAQDGTQRLLANGQDVTDALRAPRISMLASAMSAKAVVRACLLDIQRNLGAEGGAVFEGRDMGTVVFPNADVKFYLDADQSVRAQRRYEENLARKTGETLKDVENALAKRDRDDAARALAPLKPAPDAIRLDSSRDSADAVVETMLTIMRKHAK